LNRNKTKDVHQLFSKGGENYAKFRPDYPPELYEKIMEYVGRKDLKTIPKGSTVVDIACGAGEATKELVQYYDRIIGIDISQNQLKSAYKHEKITYQVGNSEKTNIESNSVDLVTVAQALHWFEFDQFFTEMDRILKKKRWCYCCLGLSIKLFYKQRSYKYYKSLL